MSRVAGKFLFKGFVQEVPSGTINGSNTAFTIGYAPMESEVLMVFLNGLLQRQGTDYTFSGTTITFAVAPASNSTLDAFYFMKNSEN